MKKLYRLAFFVSLALVLLTSYLPPSRGIPIERRLLGNADKWTLSFKSPDHTIIGIDEDRSKSMLLDFLKKYRDYFWTGEHLLLPAFLMSMLFSFIGWRREAYLQNTAEQDAAANP